MDEEGIIDRIRANINLSVVTVCCEDFIRVEAHFLPSSVSISYVSIYLTFGFTVQFAATA